MISAKAIDLFFFMAGGVILPHITTVIQEVLCKHGLLLNDQQRLALQDLEQALFIGELTPYSFLKRAGALSLPAIESAQLLEGILRTVHADEDTLQVADALRKRGYTLYLVSEYPPEWLEQIASHVAALRLLFSSNRLVFTSSLKLKDIYGDIFSVLRSNGQIVPGKTLWIDAHPWRTSAAIRRGIDAIIYVDSRRLRRELALRQLVTNSTSS
ncbi:MAG: hypothetical protein HPY45_16590 [Anaerolineae bacterium]|nr:hypothetical protein [Anaerolineae bacterium]